MKSSEELAALREELEAMSRKLAELTEEELKEVAGGAEYIPPRDIFFVKGTFADSGPYLVGSSKSDRGEPDPDWECWTS